MKHIFTVHSPLTFLMAYTIIKKNQIPEDDVIVISSGYNPPIKLEYISKSFQDINKGLINTIKTWNVPPAYDKYINSLTNGDEYIAYIDLLAMYQRILITNPKCKAFHFIEEGSISYVKPCNLDEITHFFERKPYRYKRITEFFEGLRYVLRGYTIRIMTMPYWPENYVYFDNLQFYCLSPKAYPGVPTDNKTILKLNKDSSVIREMAKDISLVNEIIWIEDSFTKVFGMSEHLYREAIISTLDYLHLNIQFSKIYLKLRPNQVEGSSIVYRVLSEMNYKVEILGNEIVIEALLANSEDCNVIGNVSSVLFYAPILGHRSISMFNRLKDKPKTTFDDFEIFWKDIIKF